MSCTSCRSKLSQNYINFGRNYKCSDLLRAPNQLKVYKKYPISLAFCSYCHLVQLRHSIKFNNIVPKINWIKNKEEDSYHAKFINHLIKKQKLKKKIKILAISSYDQSYVNELKKKGFRNIKFLNLKNDLGVKSQHCERQEVIQNFLDSERATYFLKKIKIKFDLIICSKLLEHSQSVKKVLSFLSNMLGPYGQILIDVPDSFKSLKQGNISMVWEEHKSYFTYKTLVNTVRLNGLKKILHKKFIFKQEDNLVFTVKKDISTKNGIFKEKSIFFDFKKKQENNLYKLLQIIKKFKKKNYNFLIFGGGHNSIAFLNFYKLKKYINFIIDDDKRKKNLIIAGTKIKINNFDFIKKNFNKIIFFLGTNIKSEKIIEKKIKKIKETKVLSIYPDSRLFYNK